MHSTFNLNHKHLMICIWVPSLQLAKSVPRCHENQELAHIEAVAAASCREWWAATTWTTHQKDPKSQEFKMFCAYTLQLSKGFNRLQSLWTLWSLMIAARLPQRYMSRNSAKTRRGFRFMGCNASEDCVASSASCSSRVPGHGVIWGLVGDPGRVPRDKFHFTKGN